MEVAFSHQARVFMGAEATKDMDAIEKAYTAGRALCLSRISTVAASRLWTVPVDIHILAQVCLRRTVSLTESFVREINALALLGPFLITRAALESVCFSFDLYAQAAEISEKKEVGRLVALGETVRAAQQTTRSKALQGAFERPGVNILTIIDRFNKNVSGVRGLYEHLSEYCHPNWPSTLGAFYNLDNEREEVTLFDPPDDDRRNGLRLCLSSFGAILVVAMEAATQSAELVPSLVTLWEDNFHKEVREGSWRPCQG